MHPLTTSYDLIMTVCYSQFYRKNHMTLSSFGDYVTELLLKPFITLLQRKIVANRFKEVELQMIVM